MVKADIQRVVLVGLGAQAKYALEIFSHDDRYRIVGLIDLDDAPRHHTLWGLPVFGSLATIDASLSDLAEGVVICCADSGRKEGAFQRIRSLSIPLINAIHPRACVARTAGVGQGVIINPGAVVQPFAHIGDGVMLHANAVVEHDCVVGNFANLAPSATLAGWVQVGAHARIFTGASVIPKVVIGAWATIGAGAVVHRDVPDHALVAGVPAKPLVKDVRSRG